MTANECRDVAKAAAALRQILDDKQNRRATVSVETLDMVQNASKLLEHRLIETFRNTRDKLDTLQDAYKESLGASYQQLMLKIDEEDEAGEEDEEPEGQPGIVHGTGRSQLAPGLELDLAILRCIEAGKNGEQIVLQVSAECNVSQLQVGERIAHLEQDGQIRKNIEAIGYAGYEVVPAPAVETPDQLADREARIRTAVQQGELSERELFILDRVREGHPRNEALSQTAYRFGVRRSLVDPDWKALVEKGKLKAMGQHAVIVGEEPALAAPSSSEPDEQPAKPAKIPVVDAIYQCIRERLGMTELVPRAAKLAGVVPDVVRLDVQELEAAGKISRPSPRSKYVIVDQAPEAVSA